MRDQLLVAVVCASVLGCGSVDKDLPDIARVSGVVTFDGVPLSDVEVFFQPSSGDRGSFGVTNSEGRYTLTYKPDTPGAVIGEHKVYIRSYDPENDSLDDPDPNAEPGEDKFEVPARYNSATELTATVGPDDNAIDFSLSGGG